MNDDTNAEGGDRSQRYRRVSRLGEGTFGDVTLAVDRFTGAHVAVKSVRIMQRERDGIPRAVFRELEALRQLQSCSHGCVVDLLDYYPDETNLCLVFEYLPTNLGDVIQRAEHHLPVQHFKAFSWMLFDALSHCHAANIIHRDIKPQSKSLARVPQKCPHPLIHSPTHFATHTPDLLISAGGQLKLGDFGLARPFDAASRQSLSHQVSTRWYRAPELLFASRHYDLAVDVWSAGAVLAELLALHPLFPGNNDIDQIYRVFQVMGSPSPESWPGAEALPDFSKISFPNLPPVDFRLLMPHAGPADVAFLRTLLVMDPARRATAADARDCAYLTADVPQRCSPLELATVVQRLVGQNQGQGQGQGQGQSKKKGSDGDGGDRDGALPKKGESMATYLSRFAAH